MSRYLRQWKQIESYWLPIALFTLGALALFLYHLATGYVPRRAALVIDLFGLEIYWYGILIISGVALGCWVVARLARERGQRVWATAVSPTIRRRPISALDLPEAVDGALRKQGIQTIGELLLQWGFTPDNLVLSDEQRELVRERLAGQPGVDAGWLDDAPWRPWNPDYVWSGVIWCLVLAIIGARLYHVLTPSPSMAAFGIFSPLDYFRQPYQLINLRAGGLGIYGGIAGGLLGLWLFARRYRLDALGWADLAAVGVPLGQYIGRWGNFVNQELYGRPTDLPWAIHIEPVHRLSGYTQFTRFHPAFLYESLWNLLTFLVLLRLARHHQGWLKRGDLTALYLVFYGVGRIMLETVRLDSRTVQLGGLALNLSIAALVSLLVALAMAVVLIWRHRSVAR